MDSSTALSTQWPIYSGCGNTFAVKERDGFVPVSTDGLLCLLPSTRADFRMRIFNRDGSEAEMCGNGLRCLIAYARDRGLVQEGCRVETAAAIHSCTIDGETVTVSTPLPRCLGTYVIEGREWHHIDACVPHAVSLFDRLPDSITRLGRFVRYADCFGPKGTNATCARIEEDGSITVRTYERGVEAETAACGTGAAAAYMAAHRSEATVMRFTSGESLTIVRQNEELLVKGAAKRIEE